MKSLYLLALSTFCLGTFAVQAQDVVGFEFTCPAPEDLETYDPQACAAYPDHQQMFQRIQDEVGEATEFITDVGGAFPNFDRREGRNGIAQEYQLTPVETAQEIEFRASAARGIPPDGNLAQLDHAFSHLGYSAPAIRQFLNDTVTDVSTEDCRGWLYEQVYTSLIFLNVERGAGVPLIDLPTRYPVAASGFFSELSWGNSLHIPEGRAKSDRFVNNRISVACTQDPVNDQTSFRDDLGGTSGWALFYDQLYFVLGGDGADVRQRARLAMSILENVPGLLERSQSSAAPRRAVVVAFHNHLMNYHVDGLTHFYPTVIARFLDPDRPDLLELPVFNRVPTNVIDVGETITVEGSRLDPLSTRPMRLALGSARNPDAMRRLVVDMSTPPEWADRIDDLHVIVDGEVYSDTVQVTGDGADRTVRAVITIDDPTVDTAWVGYAHAPAGLSHETADDQLRWVRFDTSISLEEVNLCDIALFSDFTNPRLARASGNIGMDGQPSLPWLSEELGPRTQSTIAFATPQRAVGEGAVCVDHLAATDTGVPVFSLYTPNPLALLGGGFAALSVAHDGWGGWPPDSTFKLTVLLPDVTVAGLRAGRSYRAVLPRIMSEGFSAIYTDYDGRFTGPGPSDFEGQSTVIVAQGAQGLFLVEEAAAGFLRGQLTISGPAEYITWEHERLSDGRYQMDGDDAQTTLSITGEITIEATDDSLRLLREGGQLDTAVIE